MAAGSASSRQLRFDVESAQTLPADSQVTPPIDSPKQTVELPAPMLFGLSHNPHLLTRPDRSDPAYCFVGVGRWVFGPLLSQGKRADSGSFVEDLDWEIGR